MRASPTEMPRSDFTGWTWSDATFGTAGSLHGAEHPRQRHAVVQVAHLARGPEPGSAQPPAPGRQRLVALAAFRLRAPDDVVDLAAEEADAQRVLLRPREIERV